MLLYRFVWFLFVRPSVLSPVLPSCRRSFSSECKVLSLMHVSMIFLISYFKFLTSNFDIYSLVGMLAYESMRPMCARIISVRFSVYTPGWPFLYLTDMYMFKYFCPPVSLMPCLRCPSVHLSDRLYACLCGSMCVCLFFCSPFCMHPWMFYFSVCTWECVRVS